MVNSQYFFDHPKIPTGHELQKHCLYKITSDNWHTNL